MTGEFGRGDHWSAEVVIVGGGPAGSSLARALSHRGHSTLLVDRATFPRPKPCGDCLNPGGVAVLRRMGLLERVMASEPIPLAGWTLVSPGGRAATGRFPHGRCALGVDRTTFDHSLLEAAREAGARVEEGVRIVDVDSGAPGGPLATGRREGEEVRIQGRILVGADGLRSIVARKIGAVRRPPRTVKASFSWKITGSGPPRDRGFLLLGGELTVGLAPAPPPEGSPSTFDPPRWNGTLVVDPRRYSTRLRRGDPWMLFQEGLDRLGLEWESTPRRLEGPWASGPFDFPVRSAVSGRILLVGDAAGYFDPLTGQGIYRALRSAELAAPIIDSALSDSRISSAGSVERNLLEPVEPQALRDYGVRLKRAFRTQRALQQVIDRVLARRRLREWVVGALGRHPTFTSRLIGVTGDLEPVHSLVNPLLWTRREHSSPSLPTHG